MHLCNRYIGAIPVTIVTGEDHESSVSITRVPVEFGSDITDHAYVEPKSVTLKGMIGPGFTGQGSFSRSAGYQALVRYQESRVPFTLVTGLTFYRNMLIEKISVPRNPDNANVLEFTATLRQVLIVGSGYVASTIGAIEGGQAYNLSSERLHDGVTRLRGSPTIKRGDNVVRAANVDISTREGRRNLEAVARIGVVV